MRIAPGTSSIGTAAAEARPAARVVEAQRTPATRGELRSAIARAVSRQTGKPAPDGLVDVLTAQASLETASGQQMYNFNFGGIKGRGPSGATAICRTHEVVNGKEITIKDGFRAYGSLDEGAADYVKLMQNRFGSAVDAAGRGDVDGFAHALKKSGYYTASETDYASGLRRLMGVKGDAGVEKAAQKARGAASTFATTADLSKVENAVDRDRWDALPIDPSFAFGSHGKARGREEEEEEDG